MLAVLLMPDATASTQHGTLDSNRAPTGGPRLDQVDEIPPEAANLRRQGCWDCFQAPLPGPALGEAFLLRQQEPQGAHLCGRLGYHAQQFMDIVHMTINHDYYGFQKQAIWVNVRTPPASFRCKRRHRHTIDEFD